MCLYSDRTSCTNCRAIRESTKAQGDVKEHVNGLILVRYVQFAASMLINVLFRSADGTLLTS